MESRSSLSGADFDRLGNAWGIGSPGDQKRLLTTARFVGQYVSDPRCVIECGALHGALTDRLLADFPQAEIHLIEIAASHAAVLRQRFADQPTAEVHEADMRDLAALPIPVADAVLLVECLYYLNDADRHAFVQDLRSSHPRATVIVATPTTGGAYFTEAELRRLFADYQLVGVDITNWRSIVGTTILGEALRGRLCADRGAWRLLRRALADHAVYAFAPPVSA